MSPALNYKALLYTTPTHLPSICPFTRPHVIISALSMHLPPVLWAWIRAPATHFLCARILTTLPLSIPPAAFSALPQHLPSPFSVIILSSQYLFQRGPIWMLYGTGAFTPSPWELSLPMLRLLLTKYFYIRNKDGTMLFENHLSAFLFLFIGQLSDKYPYSRVTFQVFGILLYWPN